jgi:predicted transposase/invertase (TIGR01784 family)
MAEIDNPHDKFFKEVFGQPDIAADFITNYLPAEVVAELDLSAPELVKDSFIDASLQEHFSDLLYKVKLRGVKAEAFIFFLFEHKSEPDKWVALQILRYLLEFWEREKRAGATRLPPIFPVVFYHGKARWRVPANFNALVDFQAREYLKPFVPEYKYFLCDLSALEEQQIHGTPLLQTALLLMKNIRRKDLLAHLRRFWSRLKTISGERAGRFLSSCVRYVSAASKHLSADDAITTIRQEFALNEGEIMASLTKEWLQQGRQEGLEIGIQQGIQVGRQQELVATCVRQLHRRIGIFPAPQEAQIRNLSVDQLIQLSEDLLDFSAAADLSNWLTAHATQGKRR